MKTFMSKMYGTLTRHILGLTLYDMMRSSHDFEDVRAALNDRIDWSIELVSTSCSPHTSSPLTLAGIIVQFRSCFTIRLSNGGYFFMLCSLSLLVMAENIHIHYGRLSPAELKERAEHVGYAPFAILFAVLDIGIVIVRVSGLVALSGSPALATSLVLVSMSPSVILPMLTYPTRLLRQRKRKSGGEAEVENGTVFVEFAGPIVIEWKKGHSTSAYDDAPVSVVAEIVTMNDARDDGSSSSATNWNDRNWSDRLVCSPD
ncbi:hypothetical protein J3R83DRAFT_13337 [Lanmaoa asiatica]|nr:hypothetical protein J3R83DRAFT_13337 [Lanmaoa asiatica]